MTLTEQYIREAIENDVDYCQRTIAGLAAASYWMTQNADKLVEIGLVPNTLGSQVQLQSNSPRGNASREQVLAAIKAWPGKWTKVPYQTQITYRNTSTMPTLSITTGDLPPTCKLVAVETAVPAQPAKTVTTYKIECTAAAPQEEEL